MGLYERLTTGDETVVKIPVHPFASSLRELARGAITKADVVSAFGLDVTEESELDSIIAQYQAQSNNQQKAEYLVKIHDVFVLSESGNYPMAKAKSELGF